jgi:cytochrome c oxidase cbb3-type subunit III
MSNHHDDNPDRVKPEDLPPGIELRPHEYDGIQEYDQRLPNWWLWTLYLAIIFFVVWWLGFYQGGIGRDDAMRIEEHMRKVAAKAADELQALFAEDPDGALWKMSVNPVSVEAGKAVYEEKCMSCHGRTLNGMDGDMKLQGLALSDGEWKYGGDPFRPLNVFHIVEKGSPDPAAGMQAWLTELGPTRVANVVAYVLSHHEAPAEALQPDATEAAPAAPGSEG